MRLIICYILMSTGLFFFLVGTIGILRLPDAFTRIHSSSKCDTLGAILTLSSLIVYNGLNLLSLKILLIIIFIWLTNPVASHIIAKFHGKNSHRN